MNIDGILGWLNAGLQRREILSRIHQPLTVVQVSRREAVDLDRAGYLVWELASRGLLACLNESARQCRLYWLSELGVRCQQRLRHAMNLPRLTHHLPRVDWAEYGWVCFRHRSTVVKALDRPSRPAHLKRRIRRRDAGARISANNVRDLLKLMARRRIVEPIRVDRDPFLWYGLTRRGRAYRDLLLRVGVRA